MAGGGWRALVGPGRRAEQADPPPVPHGRSPASLTVGRPLEKTSRGYPGRHDSGYVATCPTRSANAEHLGAERLVLALDRPASPPVAEARHCPGSAGNAATASAAPRSRPDRAGRSGCAPPRSLSGRSSQGGRGNPVGPRATPTAAFPGLITGHLQASRHLPSSNRLSAGNCVVRLRHARSAPAIAAHGSEAARPRRKRGSWPATAVPPATRRHGRTTRGVWWGPCSVGLGGVSSPPSANSHVQFRVTQDHSCLLSASRGFCSIHAPTRTGTAVEIEGASLGLAARHEEDTAGRGPIEDLWVSAYGPGRFGEEEGSARLLRAFGPR